MCDRQIQKKYVPVLCINLISDTALSNYIERDTLFTSFVLFMVLPIIFQKRNAY